MKYKEFVLHNARQFGTLVGLFFLIILLWILTPHFLTVSNLMNVAQQTSINAIIAVGMTFVIIAAGIDLSVGSIMAFSGVVLASALEAGLPLPIALLISLAIGMICGLLNGLFITFGKLPPFIATLGMMSVARGAALLYTQGRPISGFGEGFRSFATGEILGKLAYSKSIPEPGWVVATGIYVDDIQATLDEVTRNVSLSAQSPLRPGFCYKAIAIPP